VQDEVLTQLAIDRRLTLIAFEAMNHRHADGTFALHVFHKNNELAGYSSVLHALQLRGLTGDYGRRLRAAVIGFGATARGAVTALKAHGIHDVDVLTNREVAAVASPIHSARIMHFHHDDENPRRSQVMTEDGLAPLSEFLAGHDLIVNCVLQDTDAPLTFLVDDDLPTLARGTLIVDVSCDLGMGFSWARPTSFDEPMFTVGDNVHYYGVDHTPSYLWDSATWENSQALLPYLPVVLAGGDGWDADETIRRAIEIREGVVQNPDILSFQRRTADYPHVAGAVRAG
jgi:alanine dehydrogenase